MKKPKSLTEADFLSLLERILPKTTTDPHLATAIYGEVAKEIRLRKSLAAFETFCAEGSLPDLEPQTVADFQDQLGTNFGKENVTLAPDEDGQAISVEISLPDREITSKVRVAPPTEEEEAPLAPLVPFPVSLPTDPELVWLLARRENFSPEESSRALESIQEEFWETKVGLKLLRDGADRTFAEFIANVPAAALAASNLKRHYKVPEPLQILRAPQASQELQSPHTSD